MNAAPGGLSHVVHHRPISVLCMAQDAAAEAASIAGGEARDDLQGVVEPTASWPYAPRTLTLQEEIEELYATLELYDERLVAEQERVEAATHEAELSVQRTGAFWIDRLAGADAKATQAEEKTAAAEAKAKAAEAKAAAAEARAAAAEAKVAEAEAAREQLVKQLAEELPKLIDSLVTTSPAPAAAPSAEVKVAEKAAEVKVVAKPAAKATVAADEKEGESMAQEVKPKEVAKAARPAAKAAAKAEKKKPVPVDADKAQEEPTPAKTEVAKAQTIKPAAPAEPAVEPPQSMLAKYTEALAKDAGKGADDGFSHVAQFEVAPGLPHDQFVAMSQLPETSLDEFEPGYKQLKLSELRVKLAQLGVATHGLRSELIMRYEEELRRQRTKFMSWDTLSMSWVPMGSMDAA